MALSSMTGFARATGVSGTYVWAWEVKSVNSKGLDIRLRLPPGWDVIETPARTRVAARLARGAISASLSVAREGVQPQVRVNESVLAAVLATIEGLARRVKAEPPRLDGILGIKGVMEIADVDVDEGERGAAEVAIVAGFDAALTALVSMRQREGDALARILDVRLVEIAAHVARAEAVPGRRPDAIRARLADQIKTLLDHSAKFDPDRLHQEAILIATKNDVREELDRLMAHVAQTRHLVSGGGPIGRKLDFLAQEFNRETNTLCSKANDVELTTVGLELKSVVEQFREQVQNLE
ncbi:MAG: YicC family protein [Proteobacteria bacterium]|nr:YicC family protein [Pseudomonadota bacterium]